MSKAKNQNTMALILNAEEAFLLYHALEIASVDGSIFGDGSNDKKISAQISDLQKKLRTVCTS